MATTKSTRAAKAQSLKSPPPHHAGLLSSTEVDLNLPARDLRTLVDHMREATAVINIVSKALPQDEFADERYALRSALEALWEVHGLLDEAVPLAHQLDEIEDEQRKVLGTAEEARS